MRSIHPFPARMAPDAIAKWLHDLPSNSLVMDPMCGSGVVLRQAIATGHRAIGFDIDPLAVLMSRVWTSGRSLDGLQDKAEEIIRDARRRRSSYLSLPVIKSCTETRDFIEYWFAEPQRTALARLAMSLIEHKDDIGRDYLDALLLALSRIIITKHSGASLAWDVSHSRPHRKRTTNDFDVETGFVRSVHRLADILSRELLPCSAKVELTDCRTLTSVKRAEADAIITSPPYLNAIDYLRGHKLALVWMGYTIPYLRRIRAGSVGTENTGLLGTDDDLGSELSKVLPEVASLPSRQRNIVQRYASDSWDMLKEMRRVLKPGGKLVLVLADSVVRGIEIRSSDIFGWAAKEQGFKIKARETREIANDRRYLPINSSNQALTRRMRHEIIQVFEVA